MVDLVVSMVAAVVVLAVLEVVRSHMVLVALADKVSSLSLIRLRLLKHSICR
jgi:hypothetical protein